MSPVTTTSESRREARLSRHRRVVGLRVAVVAAVLVSGVIGILGAIPASAYWQSAGSGVATISTGTLAAPTDVTVAAVSGTSVAVGWTASAGSPAPSGYFVTRTSGSTTIAACATSKTTLVTGTSCTDVTVPTGAYTYAVTAVYRSWTAVSAASRSVTVVIPNKLAFTSTPSTTAAGTALTVAVAVQSSGGVTVPTASVPVTVALGANSAGGTLSGTTTVDTDATGVATFTGLILNRTGAGYTLVATSTGLVSQTSATFAITGGAAASLAFTTSAISGFASATANLGPVTVQARDAYGNAASAPAGGISLNLSSSSTGSAVFSPTMNGAGTPISITTGASSATFYYGDTKAGSPTISVSSAVTPTITQSPAVSPAAAARLAFTSAPVSGIAATSTTIGPLTVQRQDAFGNPVSSTSETTVTLSSNSTGTKLFARTPGAQSQTTVSIPANSSIAAFYYGDTLAGWPAITASASGLGTVTQNQTITAGAPAKLLFAQQPSSTPESQVMTPVTAVIADQFGNRTTSSSAVSIKIQNDPSLVDNAVLKGTTSRIAQDGAVSFDDLSISGWFKNWAVASGYTVQISSPGLSSATSAAFDITR